MPSPVRYSAIKPMFWSLVRPDRILLPITRSAAVTTSLEADESAVAMITCVAGHKKQASNTQDRKQGPRGVLRFETICLFWTTMRVPQRLARRKTRSSCQPFMYRTGRSALGDHAILDAEARTRHPRSPRVTRSAQKAPAAAAPQLARAASRAPRAAAGELPPRARATARERPR